MRQAVSWLAALCELPATQFPLVLVSVAKVEGSAPREAGAKMLVLASALEEFLACAELADYSLHNTIDTIGGGHLEWQAQKIACTMLQAGLQQPVCDARQAQSTHLATRQQRFALGPSLGQCCGGAVHLVWEWITAAEQALFQQLRQRQAAGLKSWRVRCLPTDLSTHLSSPASPTMQLLDERAQVLAATTANALSIPRFDLATATSQCQIFTTASDDFLLDAISPIQAQLYLFGAGHVGQALIQTLSLLPCQVIWVDQRQDLFPRQLAQHITVNSEDNPLTLIRNANAAACFLVMTHSHRLDLELAEEILRRPQLAWFGLIGSDTKRQLFRKRLAQRGIDQQQLERMSCPIGIAGITSKVPALIAASVTAQLLQIWQSMAQPE